MFNTVLSLWVMEPCFLAPPLHDSQRGAGKGISGVHMMGWSGQQAINVY